MSTDIYIPSEFIKVASINSMREGTLGNIGKIFILGRSCLDIVPVASREWKFIKVCRIPKLKTHVVGWEAYKLPYHFSEVQWLEKSSTRAIFAQSWLEGLPYLHSGEIIQ